MKCSKNLITCIIFVFCIAVKAQTIYVYSNDDISEDEALQLAAKSDASHTQMGKKITFREALKLAKDGDVIKFYDSRHPALTLDSPLISVTHGGFIINSGITIDGYRGPNQKNISFLFSPEYKEGLKPTSGFTINNKSQISTEIRHIKIQGSGYMKVKPMSRTNGRLEEWVEEGGGINVNEGNIFLHDVTISYTKAIIGSALFLSHGCNLTITDSNFIKCSGAGTAVLINAGEEYSPFEISEGTNIIVKNCYFNGCTIDDYELGGPTHPIAALGIFNTGEDSYLEFTDNHLEYNIVPKVNEKNAIGSSGACGFVLFGNPTCKFSNNELNNNANYLRGPGALFFIHMIAPGILVKDSEPKGFSLHDNEPNHHKWNEIIIKER